MSAVVSVDAPGSLFVPIRRHVPGVVTASFRHVDGSRRGCVVVEFDYEYKNGMMSTQDGDTLAVAAQVAYTDQVPLVVYMTTGGALLGEGVDALTGMGRAAAALTKCSGVVPLVLVVTGPVYGFAAILVGLFDMVVMVDGHEVRVSDPDVIAEYTGVDPPEMLGGTGDHLRVTGVAWFQATDRGDADQIVGDVLSYLPSNVDELPARWPLYDDPDRSNAALFDVVPAEQKYAYDVRDVITEVVDVDSFMECKPSWATNLVIGFAAVDGYPVGVVANQPLAYAGAIDIAASQKGARFVAFCDAFNLPLLTFVDTPGFLPGKDIEWEGMIRKGAQLAFAYARATVPRVSVTLRKSFGGAYIVMDSKTMGNDLAFAWPTAQIAVMGAQGAVEVLHRKASDEERTRLIADYEERLMNPYAAAERGSIDAVIDPATTRRHVVAALELLIEKTERLPHRKHDNTPL